MNSDPYEAERELRGEPDPRTVADRLAEVAAADPDSDPLADVENGGGYPLGCGPEAER